MTTANALTFIDAQRTEQQVVGWYDWKADKPVNATDVLLRCKSADMTCAYLLFVNGTLQDIGLGFVQK
jgi:hypothetical protein